MTLPVPLRYGRNMPSLTLTNDPTDRATAILGKFGPLAAKGTFLGAARWRVVSVDSVAKTVVLEDPAGNSGPVAFDDQLNGTYCYYERTAATALVDDSAKTSDTQSTLTLDTWLTDLAVGEYLQFRANEPGIGLQSSGAGRQLAVLTHPAYVASAGYRERILDRADITSVAVLNENALLDQWSDPSALPDGWETGFNDLLEPADNPFGATFAQNTDPLFAGPSGKSLSFEALTGALTIISPPVPWTPVFLGQSMSLRARFFMTEWAAHPGFFITMRLGIKFPSGRVTTLYGTRSLTTVAQWFDNQKSMIAQPPTGKSPTASFPVLPEGVFDDLVTHGIDISVPMPAPAPDRNVNQAMVDAMADSLGLVMVLELTGKGYFCGAIMTPTLEALPKEKFSARGEANTAWSTVNQALALTAKPQRTIAVEMVDLKRMNPALDEGQVDAGVLVQLDDGLDVVRDIEAVTESRADEIDVGKKQITIGNRKKRIADLLFKSSQRAAAALSSAVSSATSGTTGTVTPPSSSGTPVAGGTNPGKLLTGNAPWWMSLSGTAGELQDVDQFDAVTQYSGGGGPQTVAVAGGRRVWVERATTGFNSNGWNLSDGNFSASADDRYLRATFWFDLNGRTVDRPVPLIQTAPTMVALGLTTDRKIELWVDDNAGGMTRLGTSTIAIPASGDRCYELRAQASVFGSTNDGFVWLRLNGVLVPFIPEGGGAPVLVFTDLELTGGSAPNNGLTLIVEWGTGGGFDFSAANGVWDSNDVYANEGGLQGVQWGERTLWRPVMGEGMFDYIAGPTGIRGAFAAVTAFGLATDDASDDDSLASGDTRSYALRPVDPDVTDILAVAPVAYLRQSNSVALITTLAITSSGDAATVTMETPGNDFRSKHSVIFAGGAPLFGVANDPHTSAQWTRDAVNAATITLTGTQVDPFFLDAGNFDPSVWPGIEADTPSATMQLSQIGLIIVYRPPVVV